MIKAIHIYREKHTFSKRLAFEHFRKIMPQDWFIYWVLFQLLKDPKMLFAECFLKMILKLFLIYFLYIFFLNIFCFVVIYLFFDCWKYFSIYIFLSFQNKILYFALLILKSNWISSGIMLLSVGIQLISMVGNSLFQWKLVKFSNLIF